MWRLAGRLWENFCSVLEGLYLWCLGIVGGLLVGIGWAAREIYDTWTLEAPLKLLDDWRLLLARAWSIKFGLASGVFAAMDIVLSFLSSQHQTRTLVLLSATSAFLGVLARLFAQKEITREPTNQLPSAGQ